MLVDFEVQRCTRRCAATDRALEAGEICYSQLEVDGANVIRKDFCEGAWKGAPETALAWWKSRIPDLNANKVKLAPNDVLIEFFERLAEEPLQQDMRYVLALLLIRRRVLRLESPVDLLGGQNAEGELSGDLLHVYCPKRDASYDVPAHMPDSARIDEIQRELSQLLAAGAE